MARGSLAAALVLAAVVAVALGYLWRLAGGAEPSFLIVAALLGGWCADVLRVVVAARRLDGLASLAGPDAPRDPAV